ncbi:carbohydrate ABC transporter permease [Deinococcus cellulosilyticus]|uniref:Glycerol-3-phosphate ABC transporter permease n=1 Tax=Deinococcus cellulosilyticus (strain DSM 18568 / NBRC 106333 / KACC 11606 / 5516J-15) TaxID=1223518 RepID=A0A511N6E6_DEIC1|nr:carbohydrate ABC transporter permease [Deinococcus cellulosilyticus]GEM48430.1 glycerol-3-phosphate ABC transporter permease [Deinococcus cellulosilyticus NBRC 106333 = KACC 11606]
MVRDAWKDALTHIALSLAVLLVAFPLLFAAIKATQDSSQVISSHMNFGTSLLQNIKTAWETARLGQYMMNSFVVTVAVTVGKTLLSLLAALAFVYFRFPLKNAVFALVLFTLMLPTELLIVSLFNLITDLRWTNTHAAIIVPFLASATGVFLFRQHFMNIPASLAEAARLDGCGPLRFLWHILIPMSWNTIGALAVIQFVYVWDQYLWPLVVMQSEDRQVVQVGLKKLIDVGGATDWGAVMAGAMISILPPLLIFTLLQEQFSRGFALGQEK